jgi:tRNA threonylcarbamoyladenosine biosynthesis protein TsaB
VRVLAIETATPIASVALVDGMGVLASRTLRAPMRHLEWVAAAIDGMLHDVGAGPDSVNGVAVGRGPGGFTGLRIGIATAAAWARARQVALAGVDTLEVLACAAAAEGLVLPVLDAYRGEVASALYRIGADGAAPRARCLVPPVVAAPEAVVAEMRVALGVERAASDPLVLAGDGLARHAGAFRAALGAIGIRTLIELPEAYPRAETAGTLARRRLIGGMSDDPAAVFPIYGRRPVVRTWQETPARPGSEA